MEYNKTTGVISNYSLLVDLERQKWNLLLPVIVFLGILMVTGIIGNCLVGYVWSTKMKRSPTTACVLLLAAFDLMTCLVGIPLDMNNLSKHYTADKPVVCKLFRFLIDFTVYGSISLLVFIAIIRYFKVCRPLTSTPISRRGIIIVSLCVGLGLAWPVLVLHGLEVRPSPYPGISGQDCGIDESLKGQVYANVYFSVLGFVFVCAVTSLAVLYICIAYHILKRNRRRAESFSHGKKKRVVVAKTAAKKGTESRPYSASSQTHYSVVTNSVMFFAITLAFILSYLPSLAMLILKAQQPHIESTLSDSHFVAYIFCFRTYFINNCINPILYGFWNRKFREECVKLLTNYRQSCQGERSVNSTTQNLSKDISDNNPPAPEEHV